MLRGASRDSKQITTGVAAPGTAWDSASASCRPAPCRSHSSKGRIPPGAWSRIGIADPASQLLIGDIGLFLANDGPQAEIGFTQRRESRGRGIATAAAREASKFLFEQTEVQRVIAITDARNLPSIRLPKRVGMGRTATRAAMFRE